mmetsp:Transcript_21590/g.36781  ORF Transcript_21590/g.36781 Transcript_21590/m.36781 type:complete len:320 (-) Transcript_21590:41-1000(-)
MVKPRPWRIHPCINCRHTSLFSHWQTRLSALVMRLQQLHQGLLFVHDGSIHRPLTGLVGQAHISTRSKQQLGDLLSPVPCCVMKGGVPCWVPHIHLRPLLQQHRHHGRLVEPHSHPQCSDAAFVRMVHSHSSLCQEGPCGCYVPTLCCIVQRGGRGGRGWGRTWRLGLIAHLHPSHLGRNFSHELCIVPVFLEGSWTFSNHIIKHVLQLWVILKRLVLLCHLWTTKVLLHAQERLRHAWCLHHLLCLCMDLLGCFRVGLEVCQKGLCLVCWHAFRDLYRDPCAIVQLNLLGLHNRQVCRILRNQFTGHLLLITSLLARG